MFSQYKTAIILVAVILVLGSVVGLTREYYVTKYESEINQLVTAHQKVIDKFEKEGIELVSKKQEEIIAKQNEINELNERLRKENGEANKRIQALLNRYRDLVNSGYRLQDPGPRSDSSGDSSGSNPGTSTGNPSTAGKRELSAEASRFLLQFGAEADQVVEQYKMCQQYVIEVRKIINAKPSEAATRK